jgi:type IV secretion system protein VirB10
MKNNQKTPELEHTQDSSTLTNNKLAIKVLKNSNKKKYTLMGIGGVVIVFIFSLAMAKVVGGKKTVTEDKTKKEEAVKIEVPAAAAQKFNDPNDLHDPLSLSKNTKEEQSTIDAQQQQILEQQRIFQEKSMANANAQAASQATAVKEKPITLQDLQYSSPLCENCADNKKSGGMGGGGGAAQPMSDMDKAINQVVGIQNRVKELGLMGGGEDKDKKNNANGGDSMQKGAKAALINPKKPSVIQNQDFMLLKGTSIPLVLKTKIDSTLAGMVIAKVAENIVSMNGNVTLLDKDTQFIGYYDKSIEEGAERLAVVWDRVVTPQGVIINLQALATDTLGGAGVQGLVNHQYGKRFGGAILLSVLNDVMAAYFDKSKTVSVTPPGGATVSTTEGRNNSKNTQGTTKEIATQILGSTMNIKPILYKNQGDIIYALLVDDVDFSDVYSLSLKKGE